MATGTLPSGASINRDPVCNPDHYLKTGLSPQMVAERWNLPSCLMNAVKYIGRYRDKGKPRQDLKKAIWYLTRQYELQCAEEEGRAAIDIDDKDDPDNPFGVAFLCDLEAAQEELRLYCDLEAAQEELRR